MTSASGSPLPRGERSSPPRSGGPATMRERRHLQPARLAKAGVVAAAWQLPPQYRSRYRLEFYGELHELPRPAQVRYAWAIFLHSWSLALALKEPDRLGDLERVRRDVRCVVGLHRFVRRYAHDPDSSGGHEYFECLRCGKFRDLRKAPPSAYLGFGG